MRTVSAIMPTRGRIEWAQQALQCFRDQTYPSKELIIVDDYDDPSFPDGLRASRYLNVKHASLKDRLSISEKRNIAARLATGEIVCHFDSDDFSAPDRISQQVELMEESGKAVAGYCSMLFYDETTKQAWKYVNRPDGYALGTSLCFLHSWWQTHPFRAHPDTPAFGEDNLFMGDAQQAGELVSVDAGQMMVARIHAGSTSPHDLSGAQQSYRAVPVTAIPKGFFQ